MLAGSISIRTGHTAELRWAAVIVESIDSGSAGGGFECRVVALATTAVGSARPRSAAGEKTQTEIKQLRHRRSAAGSYIYARHSAPALFHFLVQRAPTPFRPSIGPCCVYVDNLVIARTRYGITVYGFGNGRRAWRDETRGGSAHEVYLCPLALLPFSHPPTFTPAAAPSMSALKIPGR
ncbi:hypothetical protein EVAR_67237_1 [Eumeta japonica]|uniref:Uncharacterized protein n=1 Tax=Eumeta variegata TaxID=151549 RepID=A0A4C1YU49_EUMVA|nr:hypothetical protein EVAR_67237_1 [Eumeta japonica]